MSRSLKYDFAGPDFRVAAEDLVGPGIAKAFEPDLSPPLRLTVDLGFGRGELLLDLAAADPQAAFLGVEYSYKRALKLARRLARTRASQPAAGLRDRRGDRRRSVARRLRARLLDQLPGSVAQEAPPPPASDPAGLRAAARAPSRAGGNAARGDRPRGLRGGDRRGARRRAAAREPPRARRLARRASGALRDGVRARMAGAAPRLPLLLRIAACRTPGSLDTPENGP